MDDSIRQVLVLAAGFALGKGVGILLEDLTINTYWKVRARFAKKEKEEA